MLDSIAANDANGQIGGEKVSGHGGQLNQPESPNCHALPFGLRFETSAKLPFNGLVLFVERAELKERRGGGRQRQIVEFRL
jgi:hypothetical protein